MYVSLRDRPAKESDRLARGVLPRVATTVIVLGVVSLLTDVSSEMVNSVLPLYLTAQLGIGLLAYGFVDGLYQGVSALVRIAGGYLGDRTDQPKRVAAVGYAISAVSRLALIPVHGFAAITAVITADRLGKGLRTAPRDALIADAADPRGLGRSFGVHRTLDTIGAAIGPLVAFVLLILVPGGYTSIFVVSFAFAVVGVAVIVLFVPNRRTRAAGAPVGLRQMLRDVSGPRLRRPLLAVGLLGLLTVGDGFLYLSMQRRDGLAASYFPLLYVGTNIAYLGLAIPLGRLADRIGRGKVFLGGHVTLLGAYLVTGSALHGAVVTISGLLLLGTFYAATDGVLSALVSRLVSRESRGSGIAAAQTVAVAARFASSLAFGGLWLALGRAPALLLVALSLAAVLPVAALLLRPAAASPDSPDGAPGAADGTSPDATPSSVAPPDGAGPDGPAVPAQGKSGA